MNRTLLGRTNRYVYPVWARGDLRGDGVAEERAARSLHALYQSPIEVLDITPAPALWGRFLREQPSSLQIAVASPVSLLLHAPDARIAANLVQSHIVEILCAIGRAHIDYYFLSVREPVGEAPLSGALETLEIARQEGTISALGLAAFGDPLASLALWRRHDAFEVALLPDRAEVITTLLPEARARRVGVVLQTDSPPEAALQHGVQAVLVSIERALQQMR